MTQWNWALSNFIIGRIQNLGLLGFEKDYWIQDLGAESDSAIIPFVLIKWMCTPLQL